MIKFINGLRLFAAFVFAAAGTWCSVSWFFPPAGAANFFQMEEFYIILLVPVFWLASILIPKGGVLAFLGTLGKIGKFLLGICKYIPIIGGLFGPFVVLAILVYVFGFFVLLPVLPLLVAIKPLMEKVSEAFTGSAFWTDIASNAIIIIIFLIICKFIKSTVPDGTDFHALEPLFRHL